ncbi:MAG: SHOCT domain-containing protein [Chloroflexota bacterium]
MIAKELEALARLHESGALTDEEFARAKKAALDRDDRPEVAAEPRESASLGNAANRYVTFQIAMTAVGLVMFVLVFIFVFLPQLNAFPRP